MSDSRMVTCTVAVVATIFAAAAGCASPVPDDVVTVSRAWEGPGRPTTAPAHGRAPGTPLLDQKPSAPRAREAPIASVNGQPISHDRFIELLLRSHGVAALDQLIALELAETAAERRGITVTEADIDREYNQSLRRLADPLDALTVAGDDRARFEPFLEAVLAQRGMSREQYMILIRRNAHLRRIVESDMRFTDQQLATEYQRAYGRRVRVRHIQLVSSSGVTAVQQALDAGEDFAEVARTHSVNTASAPQGGLLAPFSMHDDEVPESFRRGAFVLRVGEVSGAVRVGQWLHVLKLEGDVPAGGMSFEDARDELRGRLRNRAADPAMRSLVDDFFRAGEKRIHDSVLRDAFEAKHPDLDASR